MRGLGPSEHAAPEHDARGAEPVQEARHERRLVCRLVTEHHHLRCVCMRVMGMHAGSHSSPHRKHKRGELLLKKHDSMMPSDAPNYEPGLGDLFGSSHAYRRVRLRVEATSHRMRCRTSAHRRHHSQHSQLRLASRHAVLAWAPTRRCFICGRAFPSRLASARPWAPQGPGKRLRYAWRKRPPQRRCTRQERQVRIHFKRALGLERMRFASAPSLEHRALRISTEQASPHSV